jgi:hypothetical protein
MNTIQEIFTQLKARYGSHRAAAKALGINWRTYAGYRTGEYPLPLGRENHMRLLVAQPVPEASSATDTAA